MSQRGTIWYKNTFSRFSDSPVRVRACIAVLIRASKRCCSCAFCEIGRWAKKFEYTKPSPIYHGDFDIVKKSRPPFRMDIFLVPAPNHDRKDRSKIWVRFKIPQAISLRTPLQRTDKYLTYICMIFHRTYLRRIVF